MTRGHLVLDTSVVVDLLVGADSDRIAAAIDGHEWHAPSHLDIEVASALRGLVLGGHLSASRAVDALLDLDDFGIVRWPADHVMVRRVLALRDRMTAYDAGFVVCAEGLDSPIATRDGRLAAAADGLVEIVQV